MTPDLDALLVAVLVPVILIAAYVVLHDSWRR